MKFRILSFATIGLIAVTVPSWGMVLALNFGNQDLQAELDEFDRMSYGVVGNDGNADIYARITVSSSYTYGRQELSGSSSGDAHVNQQAGTDTDLNLTLYQDASYTTMYNPGVSYSYDLFFYDVDGSTTYYDQVTVFTSSNYAVTSTTELDVFSNMDGSVTARGNGTNPENVSSPNGLTSLNQNQADVTIGFTFTDTASVSFNYYIEGASNLKRNLYFDGDNLSFDGYTTTTGTVVPEPSVHGFLLSGLVFAFAFVRRRG